MSNIRLSMWVKLTLLQAWGLTMWEWGGRGWGEWWGWRWRTECKVLCLTTQWRADWSPLLSTSGLAQQLSRLKVFVRLLGLTVLFVCREQELAAVSWRVSWPYCCSVTGSKVSMWPARQAVPTLSAGGQITSVRQSSAGLGATAMSPAWQGVAWVCKNTHSCTWWC